MSRAILDDRKTQTRRPAFKKPKLMSGSWEDGTAVGVIPATPWTRVKPGDLLWVRERWRVTEKYDGVKPRDLPPRTMTVLFEAGGSIANQSAQGDWRPNLQYPPLDYPLPWAGRWRPGMFLPRWASRTTLEVTAVKIEPVQAITPEDAVAEGLDYPLLSARAAFMGLWWEIHGREDWDRNPAVVAITFKVHRQNIDMFKQERKAA